MTCLVRGGEPIVLVNDSNGCLDIVELNQDAHQDRRRLGLFHKFIDLCFEGEQAVQIAFHVCSIDRAVSADVYDKHNLTFSGQVSVGTRLDELAIMLVRIQQVW